jgi:hypothetical protein
MAGMAEMAEMVEMVEMVAWSDYALRDLMAQRLFGLFDLILLHFIAERVAVDAKQFGGAGLVAPGIVHHQLDKRFFHAAYDHIVDRVRLFAIQIIEIIFHRLAHAAGDIVFVNYTHAASSSAST